MAGLNYPVTTGDNEGSMGCTCKDEGAVTDLAEKVVEELAKKLPVERVYEDVASDAARQLGGATSDLIKTIRLVLAPIQFAAAFQDRLANFLDEAVRRVPDKNRMAPVPQILGPVLEGIRYETTGSEIEAMFSELLSRAMDKDRVGEAHPSYPGIIRQLSSDEAKILIALRDGDKRTLYQKSWPTDAGPNSGVADQHIVEEHDLHKIGLSHQDNIDFYFLHLSVLGLATTQKDLIEELPSQIVDGVVVRRSSRHKRVFRLTEFGRHFVTACSRT